MAAEAIGETGDARRLRSRNGVPRVALESIEASVKAIWIAARRTEAAPVTIARAITGKGDAKASGGAWNKRIAALRGYNVIERTSYKLTEIGLAIANDADVDGHSRGLRDAVLSVPAYRKFLERADGEELPGLALLASEIEFEYELSHPDALSAARVFVESATYAGLVNESGRVSLAGVVVAPLPNEDVLDGEDESEPEPEPDSDSGSNLSETAAEAPPAPARPAAPDVLIHTPTTPPARDLPDGPSSPAALKIKIDMTEWAADDVVKVLTAIGYGQQNDVSD